jgi:hypothetical protein
MWCDTLNGGCVWPKFWEWWAPAVYFDTKDPDGLSGNANWDVFTTVDYDGNQNAVDNGDNIGSFDKAAWSYYSYVKTDTHVYVGYHFYFPRRWSNAIAFGTNYENHMQSVLMVIAIDSPEPGAFGGPNGYGTLILMETTSDTSFYRYVPEGSPLLDAPFSLIDGVVQWDETGGHPRPTVFIEAENHGIKGDKSWNTNGYPEDNGVTYTWDFIPGVDPGLNGTSTYALMSLAETLWPERTNLGSNNILSEFAKFAGDQASSSKSLLPWGYRDNQLGSGNPAGEILFDPATLIRRHYGTQYWGGPFSTEYTYNPYALKVKIADLWVKDDGSWLEANPDPYINLYLRDGLGAEHKVLGRTGGLQNNWFTQDVEVNTLINLSNGETSMGRNWFYGLEYTGTSYFGIEIRDADFLADGWLMDPGARSYHSFTGTDVIDWIYSDSLMTVTLP